ncbi:MAG TPA: ABC transporter permease [Actinomycetota bacterium]|nr:ABC transporter permease [Actinomycetota bacterium]
MVAVGVAVALGAAMVATAGESPLAVYRALTEGAFDRHGLPSTLSRAVPIVGAGLAAAVAFRAGFFTLGVEGQMVLGGLVSALTAIALAGLGAGAITVSVLAAVGAGAAYAGLATWFEFRFGVPILISTLLMNYPAVFAASYLVSGPAGEAIGGVSQTALLPEAARLGELVPGTRLNVGAFVVLVLVGLAAFAFRGTWLGYEARMTGLNPRFARYGGVAVERLGAKVMLASGVIAGLVGAIQVLGVHYRFIDGSLTGPLYAWIGLMAALLANSNPVGVVVAGLFFSALHTGGLEVERSTDLARELALVLQALIIMLVACRGAFRARDRVGRSGRAVGREVAGPSEAVGVEGVGGDA